MDQLLNQQHSRETIIYAISRLLERASYYGLRALLLLYLIGEVFDMDHTEAIILLSVFTGGIVISQIIGAVLGDLLLGSKRAILIGGFIQALGSFILCIPSTIGLYTGIALILIGGGLYSPNITAHFGKLYLQKTKLLDAGFTVLYTATSLGAFSGIVLIGYIGETINHTAGFAVAGGLMLLSTFFPLIIKESTAIKIPKSDTPISKRVIIILATFLLTGLFWAIYDISQMGSFEIQKALGDLKSSFIPENVWYSLNSIFIIPISIIAIILWSYRYSTQFAKLAIGFIFVTISYGVLYIIPESPDKSYIPVYIVSLLLFTVAEIHIAPIIHSILTRHSNPKYLAIIISLSFIPVKILSLIIGPFRDHINGNVSLSLMISIIVTGLIGISLIIYMILAKMTKH